MHTTKTYWIKTKTNWVKIAKTLVKLVIWFSVKSGKSVFIDKTERANVKVISVARG